jgi:molybdenum cofactor cytidylyltransferase
MVIAAILLAAGAEEIDGTPLALLPWREDETLIEYHVAQLHAAGVDAIEVVLGYDAERAIPLVAGDNVEPIVNARWRTDAASSVRVGASAVPRDTHAAIVVRLNEPRPADVYRRLLDAHLRNGAPITRPAFRGIPGAPIVVGRAMLAELRNATDNGGLDGIIAGYAGEIADVAFDDRIVLLHIADADGYRQARSDYSIG